MAKKKTEKTREWHLKAMVAFMDQVGAGEALDGLTVSEMREHMDLTDPSGAGWNEVWTAMQELRNEGFLAHKFSHELLKEDFFIGDPIEIPNIQKRENSSKVRMLVFFVSPAAMSLGDDLEAAVKAGSLPSRKDESGKFYFTRETIAEFYNSLAQVIDDNVTDPAYHANAAKHITALKP